MKWCDPSYHKYYKQLHTYSSLYCDQTTSLAGKGQRSYAWSAFMKNVVITARMLWGWKVVKRKWKREKRTCVSMLVLVLSELIFFRDFEHQQNVHLFLFLGLDGRTGHLCFHPAAADHRLVRLSKTSRGTKWKVRAVRMANPSWNQQGSRQLKPKKLQAVAWANLPPRSLVNTFSF